MNFNLYVERPWQPRGCWELLRAFYQAELGITLPTYAEEYAAGSPRNVTALVLAESVAWEEVAPGDERPGDGVLFRGVPLHVGVVCGRGRMLHMPRNKPSVIERYRTPLWQPQLQGFRRHRGAA
jgi:cell wall-associated NlpC family hydrolase